MGWLGVGGQCVGLVIWLVGWLVGWLDLGTFHVWCGGFVLFMLVLDG